MDFNDVNATKKKRLLPKGTFLLMEPTVCKWRSNGKTPLQPPTHCFMCKSTTKWYRICDGEYLESGCCKFWIKNRRRQADERDRKEAARQERMKRGVESITPEDIGSMGTDDACALFL